MPAADRLALRTALFACLAHFEKPAKLWNTLRFPFDSSDSRSLNAPEANRLAAVLGTGDVFRIETEGKKTTLWVNHPTRETSAVPFGAGTSAGEFGDHAREAAIANLKAWLALAEGATPEDEPALSERQYDVLDAVYDLKAFAPETRVTTEDVSVRLKVEATQLKQPISELVGLELLKSKKGRGGGVWLSEAGKSHVERQRKR